ncbi:MAG TPA: protein kinase [Fimbriiglobus sp.]|nr:protein kinase [Fimbriiglobus sp.]
MNRSQDSQDPLEDGLAVSRTDRTIDSATFARVIEVRQRFEEAWQAALAGAPEPRIETYLNLGSEEVRQLLTVQLQEVQRAYKQRMSTHTSGATENTAVFSSPPTAKDLPAGPDRKPNLQATAASSPGAEDEFDSNVALPPTPPPVRVTGYEVLGRIGHGGMGVVYKARHVRLDRVEALKMVLGGAHASPDQLARFRAEAQAAAQLQHPNIVQVHEVGEVDGLPYFSLEYVDGGSLAQKLGGQPQPFQFAAHLVMTLAGGIEYAHKHLVLHRDLKPSNILLSPDGVPKITDFGLAKRLESDSTQTRSGTILGTPSYMAPEQARGEMKATDPSTDVYGLGTILYECLTGRAPFVAATQVETLKQVIGQEPVPPSRLRPGVPRDLETICLKCLQKEQSKRYPTAAALARDLNHYLAGEPIAARPVGKAERLWRWCRRNPGVAAMSATIFALLAAVAITSTVLLVRISQEKAQTEIERKAAVVAGDLARRNEIAAREAKKLAEANAQVATEQSELAVGTLSKLVTRVQSQLRSQPGNQKLRQDILTDALAGLQEVVGKAAEGPQSQWVRTAAYQHMGDIARDLGRTEEALAHYRECQKITEAMLGKYPDGQLTRWNLAIVYDKLGDINHQFLGDGVVARDYYVKSLGLRQVLAREPLTSPGLTPARARSNLLNTYSKLGSLALATGDPAAAWDQYRTFLSVLRGRTFASTREALVVANTPEGARLFPAGLANRIGELSFHLGDTESARKWSALALRRARAAAARSKASDQDKLTLTGVINSAGDLALYLGDAAAAVKLYTEAHAMVVGRAATDPTAIDLRRAVSLSHYRLGTAGRALGETEAADGHFRECLAIREALAKEDPANVFTQIDLALALARSGRHADAAARTAEFRKRAPKDPSMLFYAGCSAALCAAAAGDDKELREKYLAQSVAALGDAVGVGYRDVAALEHDPDLAPVRGDPRFQELIRKLKPADR